MLCVLTIFTPCSMFSYGAPDMMLAASLNDVCCLAFLFKYSKTTPAQFLSQWISILKYGIIAENFVVKENRRMRLFCKMISTLDVICEYGKHTLAMSAVQEFVTLVTLVTSRTDVKPRAVSSECLWLPSSQIESH